MMAVLLEAPRPCHHRSTHPQEPIWEVALKETIGIEEYRFEPPVELVCRHRGIAAPEAVRTLTFDGESYLVYRFAWPEDAAEFLAHFTATEFCARLCTSAEALLAWVNDGGGGDSEAGGKL